MRFINHFPTQEEGYPYSLFVRLFKFIFRRKKKS